MHLFEEAFEDDDSKPKKSSEKEGEEESGSESESKEQPRLTGTILWWRNGAGQILADSGEALAVHQVDLQCSGRGARELPINHMCEYEKCVGQMGEARACEVSRAGGRPWIFKQEKPVIIKTEEGTDSKLPGLKPPLEEAHANQQFQYKCTTVTERTVAKGIVLYFNAELHYVCIKPDDEPEGELYCDASDIVKKGSFMSVRRGVKVEFLKGTNASGLVVATECTGPNRKPIDNNTKKTFLPRKRKLEKVAPEKRKKLKPVEPDIELPPKPDIPEGKNPVSIINEFAVSCAPKKIVTFKLVEEEIRARPTNGVRTAFTFECRLDDEPVGKGTAQTKRVAKTYAAQFGLENLSKKNVRYKAEIERIRSGLPSVKKRPPPFQRPYGQNKMLLNSYVLSRAYQNANISRRVEVPFSYPRKAYFPKTSYPPVAPLRKPTAYERAYEPNKSRPEVDGAPSTSYSSAYDAPASSYSETPNPDVMYHGVNEQNSIPPSPNEGPMEFNGFRSEPNGIQPERQEPSSYASAYHPPAADERHKDSNNPSLQGAYFQAQTDATRTSYPMY